MLSVVPESSRIFIKATASQAAERGAGAEASAGESTVQLGHKWAGWFMQTLLEAADQQRAMTATDFFTCLRKQGVVRMPDRTGMRRILEAAQAGLDALMGPNSGVELISHGARSKTTGPWRWAATRAAALSDLPPAASNVSKNGLPEPRLTLMGDLRSDLHVLHGLMEADEKALIGEFRAAHATLVRVFGSQCENGDLSADGRLLVLLRMARHARQGNQPAEAKAALEHAQRISLGKGLAYPGARAEVLQLAARLAYDQDPTACTRSGFALSETDIECGLSGSVNARLAGEWCNLQALMGRRRAVAAMEALAPGGTTTVVEAKVIALAHHQKAVADFTAAIYWVLAAHDLALVQRLTFNVAYHLQEMCRIGLTDHANGLSIIDARNWYLLAITYASASERGEHDAWQYIFLGQLYLDHPTVREAHLHGHAAWPADYDPGKAIFYEHAVRHSRGFGDARQLVLALWNAQRIAALHKQYLAQRKARKELFEMLDAAPALALRLEAEGYRFV